MSKVVDKKEIGIDLGAYKFGFHDDNVKYAYKAEPGLTEATVRMISEMKDEPAWMLEFRLRALKHFEERPIPEWGGGGKLATIDFDAIYYYLKPEAENARTWDDVPDDIKNTFDRLGIPEAEKTMLAGVGAQYDSEVIYHKLKQEWVDQGVIFMDTDTALKEHEHFFNEYFGKIIPPEDNKFAALNSAVWSGGSFVYIPKGVKVDAPLQAYFRINSKNAGQFERTLIIADEGSDVHYVEGCTAPVYTTDALHCAVVEIIVKEGARVRYTTIQNWSNDVYNLVTKRTQVHKNGVMQWVDCNIGSQLTMKYPSCYLVGEGAHGEVLSVAFAGPGQHQDAGAKMIHVAPNTTSRITSKSISKGSGRSTYRGLLKVHKGATGVKANVECDALLMDEEARTDTYPYIEINEMEAEVGHEARVSKVSEDQIFYLQSRGISADAALGLIINGFLEPVTKELPLEYAVEMNRLIELEMEGSVG